MTVDSPAQPTSARPDPRLRDDWAFILFGFLTAFGSSFGQTYFIGVFQEPISAEFALSKTGFGGLYLTVTLVSAFGLNLLGHVIDRIDLAAYMLRLTLALGLAVLALGLSGPLIAVTIALMAARLTGQGLMVHAAMTSMSRYFERRRGRAVSVAGLGMPAGQALLPPLAVWLMSGGDWRSAWLVMGGLVLIGLVPVTQLLLRGHRARHARWEAREKARLLNPAETGMPSYTRRDMLKDYRFYLMMPAVLSVPFWVTAVFFYAAPVAQSFGLTLQAFTALYGFYALAAALTPLPAGWLVDRFGGARLLMLPLPCLALGLGAIVWFDGALGATVLMVALGLTLGLVVPVNNAVWAELYGTRHLGAIKSLAGSIGVVATAAAPFLIGAGLDSQLEIQDLFLVGVLYVTGSLPLLWPVVRSASRTVP